METDEKQLHEKWPELQEKLLKEYPTLTREELVLEIGKERETLERLQEKLGRNWKDIRSFLTLMG